MKKCRKPLSLRHFGTPGGGRTHGLSLRRRPLYPTELRAQIRYNPRQGRPNTFRLGGGRSILLSYGCMHMAYYTTAAAFAQGEITERILPLADSCILQFRQKRCRFTSEKHSKCRNAIAILQEYLYNNSCKRNVGGLSASYLKGDFCYGWLYRARIE